MIQLKTPSGEASIFLLVIIYFEDNVDTEYVECYAGIILLLRLGWQEAVIHLWNKLYQKVKKNQIEHGECFDMGFWLYYIDAISREIESKDKNIK